MKESDLFKKLRFTRRDAQEEHAWRRQLDAIENYLKTMFLIPEKEGLDLAIILNHALASGDEAGNHKLMFKLEFESREHKNHDIPTTSCLLRPYEILSDLRLHPIYSREALHALSFCTMDQACLETLAPYFMENGHGELVIALPAFSEVNIVKALCEKNMLFYFDPHPTLYCWTSTTHPSRLILQVKEIGEEWKLCGKLTEPALTEPILNTLDFLDIQAVTPGGLARQDQYLFEYDKKTYPWAEALLSSAAIRCPKNLSSHFFYHLLRLIDHQMIEWPENMHITFVTTPIQALFYVKTTHHKKNIPLNTSLTSPTKIEGFIWSRVEDKEYPNPIHQDQKTLDRPKVLQVDFTEPTQNQYCLSIHVPDLEAEKKHLAEMRTCTGFCWNESRHVFNINLTYATDIFYRLLNFGWEVWAENLQIKILQEIEIQLMTHSDWFELNLSSGTPPMNIPAWQLVHLLKRKRMFIQLSDGSLGILPEHWYQEFKRLFELRYSNPSQAAQNSEQESEQEFEEKDEHLRFSLAHAFHFAQLAKKAENSEGIAFKSDPIFEKIRQKITDIHGLKPMSAAPSFKLTLRPYQEVGLAWLDFLGQTRLGGCLADDMGLGKTVQVLAYLDLKRSELSQGAGIKSLLVCPSSLLEYWFQEAKKCAPKLQVFILRAADMTRLDVLTTHYDILLISYGLVRLHINTLKNIAFDFLALDEAQLIKNSGTQIAMAVHQLQAVQRLAISGTPIENHMGELFSLFEFLNPGIAHPIVLKTINTQTHTQDNIQDNAIPESSLAKFLKGIRPLILRRLKIDVAQELPEKTDQVLILPMEEQQDNIYTSLKNYYQEQLKKHIIEPLYDRSFFLEGLLRLRQASCHPLLLERSMLNQSKLNQSKSNLSTISCNKFEFLIDKLKTLVSAGHKAVVFSQFTSLLKLLIQPLDALEISYEYLDGQSQNRMDIVARFQKHSTISIFLAGIKTGGLGLNLTAADYCFILDPWWNPAIEQQAVDRIHRIGQDKPVNIYRIVSQNTVEEKMLLLKEKKQKIADQLITADHAFLEKLNYEDFQFLFE